MDVDVPSEKEDPEKDSEGKENNGGPLGRNGNYSTRARPERPLENQTWPRCQQLR